MNASTYNYLGRIADTGDHVPALPGVSDRICGAVARGAIGDCVRPIGHDGPHQGAHYYAWTDETPAADARAELVARLKMASTDAPEGMVEQIVASMDEAAVEKTLANLAAKDAQEAETREELAAHPAIAQAVLPPADWKTETDRLDVARQALDLLRIAADRKGLTVQALAEAIVTGQGTVAEGMAMHDISDPRLPEWGSTFYAFRYRIKDAVDILTAEETARLEREERARQDAAWDARGLERCERCDGKGGRKEWPGFTCFTCEGHGTLPKDR